MKKQIFAASMLLGVAYTSHAAVIDLSPTADGSVRTFGGDSVNTTDTKVSLLQSGGNITNSVFEFDLSSLNATAISSARLDITLTRFVSNTGSTPANIHIFAYNGDGVVDISDYAATGTQVVNSNTPQGGVAGDVRSFSFTDVTPMNDALVNGLLTLRIETDSFASINIASLENTTLAAANLNLQYTASAVPAPAAIWLFGSGLLGLTGIARRSNRKHT